MAVRYQNVQIFLYPETPDTPLSPALKNNTPTFLSRLQNKMDVQAWTKQQSANGANVQSNRPCRKHAAALLGTAGFKNEEFGCFGPRLGDLQI